MHNGSTKEGSVKRPDFRNDLISLFCLTVFVVIVFSGTIFSGKDVSRIGTVAHRDTLFGRLAKGSPDAMDTCIYQEHAPNYFLTEKTIAKGHLPFWNPYLGLGCPLWADSQILAFSPLTWLQAPFACLRLYNLLIVFHVWVGCVGAYIFARMLRISPCASLLSAFSYSFTPYLLYMFEWNRCQNAFFPMPFLGFAYLWRRGNFLSIVVCAILCTTLVVSGHTVPTFFAITLASCMYFALAYFMPQSKAGSAFSVLPIRNFFCAGVLTFLLSAPFVVPFLEALRASDCFKSNQNNVRYVVRQTALIPSLFYPFHGQGSPYSGAVSILLASSAFLIAKKNRKLVAILSALTVLTIGILIRFGPFDLLFQLPYVNWFMVIYALPALFLLVGVLAGTAYDSLLEEKTGMRTALIIAALAIIPIGMPFVFKSLHLTATQMELNDWLKTMTVSSSVRIRELVVLLLAVLIALAITKVPAGLKSKLALCLIVLNAVSLSYNFRKSLVERPAFAYQEVEPISFLRDQGRRVLSMGRHVLVPNTSQIFSVANLASFMPTHPRGVLKYLEAMGITIEGVGQYAEKPLTKLADAASVKYMVASEPVLSSEDQISEPDQMAAEDGISFGKEIKLKAFSIGIDDRNLDIIGALKWAYPNNERPTPLLYLLMLVKDDGSLLWIGDRHPLPIKKGTQLAEISSVLTAAIPKSLKKGEPVCLIMQVLDPLTGQLVEPTAGHSPVPNSVLLKRFSVPGCDAEKGKANNRHFRLIKETAPEMVRIYENSGCLPEAYLVFKTRQIKNTDEAITEMLKPDFDPRKMALTEESSLLSEEEHLANAAIVAGKVIRPNLNQVDVEVESKKTALMVLTDVYFPGWKATVDGKESEIYRANGVFRAVKVEPGHHTVSFTFEPSGLRVSFLLFGLGLALSVFFLLFPDRARLSKSESQSV